MAKVLFFITVEMVKAFIASSQTVTNRNDFRKLFFSSFRLSHAVPASLVPFFLKVSAKFYDKSDFGYNGIMEEIKDRAEIMVKNNGYVLVRDFLKHGEEETDFYDSSIRTAYEKKTGCGDWLTSTESTTFEEIIKEYSRRRRLIRWDYDYIPKTGKMTGKKSVDKTLSEEEQKVKQERTKKKAQNEFPVHIHIETSYKRLFEYMATYPAGLKTFFKESIRSGVAGTYIWELQTIKNSKRKIAFLENFNNWDKGITEETEETEEE